MRAQAGSTGGGKAAGRGIAPLKGKYNAVKRSTAPKRPTLTAADAAKKKKAR